LCCTAWRLVLYVSRRVRGCSTTITYSHLDPPLLLPSNPFEFWIFVHTYTPMRNVRLLRRGLALIPKRSRERFKDGTNGIVRCVRLFLRDSLDKIYKNILRAYMWIRILSKVQMLDSLYIFSRSINRSRMDERWD